jgi:hypothetical protein
MTPSARYAARYGVCGGFTRHGPDTADTEYQKIGYPCGSPAYRPPDTARYAARIVSAPSPRGRYGRYGVTAVLPERAAGGPHAR